MSSINTSAGSLPTEFDSHHHLDAPARELAYLRATLVWAKVGLRQLEADGRPKQVGSANEAAYDAALATLNTELTSAIDELVVIQGLIDAG